MHVESRFIFIINRGAFSEGMGGRMREAMGFKIEEGRIFIKGVLI